MRNVIAIFLLFCSVIAYSSGDRILSTLRLVIGNGTNNNVVIEADIGEANNPVIRYNSSIGKWERSDDGVNFEEIGAGGVSVWESGKLYEVDSTVNFEGEIYVALQSHTSDDFQDDLDNGDWIKISDTFLFEDQDGNDYKAKKLVVPNAQLTEVDSDSVLIETNNKNLLVNPGFEHSTFDTGWTVTGSATVSAETTAPLSGKKSFKAVMTGNAVQLVQDSTLYASTLEGAQLFYRLTYTNTAPGAKACIRKNGVTQSGANDCVTLATDGKRRAVEISFLGDATSNGVDVDTGTTAGTLIVDDVELSTDSKNFIDVAQISPWIEYTPTFQGFGSPTNVSFRYRIVGSNYEIDGKMTTGTVSAVEARISLPNGVVTPNFGTGTRAVTGSLLIYGNSGAVVRFPLVEPNVNYITLGEQSSTTAGLTKMTGTLVGSSLNIAFTASVPVQGLQNKTTTYSQACQKDVDCENVFSAKVSSTGVVSDENLDWINGDCGTAFTGFYSCTFNSGIFTVAPNCTTTAVSTTIRALSQVDVVTSSGISFSTNNVTTASNANIAFNIVCTKSPPDFKAKNVITGTFKEMMKVPNVSKPKTCRATFGGAGSLTTPTNCTSSPCTKYFDNCGTFSMTRSGVGGYSYSVDSGTFKNDSSIFCHEEVQNAGGGASRVKTSSSELIRANSSGGASKGVNSWALAATAPVSYTATDTVVNIKCEGEAP